MTDERCLARGSVDRIGGEESSCEVEIGSWSEQRTMPVADHGIAVAACLEQLTNPEHGVLKDASQVSAIGFKAVHGGRLSGVFAVNEDLLDAMSEMNAAAPAHNPPYIAAMKALRERFPELPLVAAFETDFHRTIPAARREYAIPRQWRKNSTFESMDFTVPVTATSRHAPQRYWGGKMRESFPVIWEAVAV